MQGMPLSTYRADLKRVPVHLNAKPVRAIKNLPDRLGEKVVSYIVERFEDDNIEEHLHCLPMKAFANLTLDETAKIKASTIYTMDQSVNDVFENDPEYEIIHKISSSMWRWGWGRGGWNDIVDAYDAIRAFELAIPGIEVRLDHTSYYHAQGYARHSRTFLDGVFAFLLYHKGEHVMTLGFSIARGGKLLLQQVQLKKRRGNRWLFKLPANRIEYFVGVFKAAFPKHTIYIVDGADVANKSLNAYRRGREDAISTLARSKHRLETATGDMVEYHQRSIADAEKAQIEMERRIDHISTEVERIDAMYANLGRFQRGKSVKMNGLTHYRIIA